MKAQVLAEALSEITRSFYGDTPPISGASSGGLVRPADEKATEWRLIVDSEIVEDLMASIAVETDG